MKRVCAWCQKELRSVECGDVNSLLTSHGICVECARLIVGDDLMTLADFLDTLDVPVVVVDDAHGATLANTRAKTLRPLPPSSIPPPLHSTNGDRKSSIPPQKLHDCVESGELGDCSRTIHCEGCTIRRAVMNTYRTGESTELVPACKSRSNPDELCLVDCWISTELVDDIVFVQVVHGHATSPD